MAANIPLFIEEMKVLYHADVRLYKKQLAKYMRAVPDRLVLVYQPAENDYCILGTDSDFANWEQHANYVFPKLETALEFPEIIFRLQDFTWQKL